MSSELKARGTVPNAPGTRAGGPPKGGHADRIRVLIADDHVTVLEGLAAIIGRQVDMKVVAEAADGQEAVDLWQKHEPDVTLLDLRMPTLTAGSR